MLTPTTLAVIILIWVLGCAVVIWLVWRAAQLDARAQREAEEPKAAPPPSHRDDEAA